MITGNNERTARAIGDQAGVEYVASGVLPDGKENLIKELGCSSKVGHGWHGITMLLRYKADVGIAPELVLM